MSRQDEKKLDRYEGYPKFYRKEYVEIEVESLDGKKLGTMNAMVYIMTKQAVRLRTTMPSNYYFALLAEGYRAFGFDKKYLTKHWVKQYCVLRLFNLQPFEKGLRYYI